MRIKITKKCFFIQSETYLDQRKKKKNCMILHFKMQKWQSYCHFCIFTVKSHNFVIFFYIFKNFFF